MTFRAANRIRTVRRDDRESCVTIYGWVRFVIAVVFGGGAVLLIAALLFTLWLFYPYTPELG